MTSAAAPQLVAVGRIGVDIYPDRAGSFAQVERYLRSLGGSATNVSVGAARLDVRAALVTKVGNDTPGAWCRAALEGFGVDTRWVGTAATAPTPVVIAELDPPESPTIHFHRTERAPDLQLVRADLPDEVVVAPDIFWFTGTGLSAEPSRATTLEALVRRGRAAHTIFDLDWRPALWLGEFGRGAPGHYAAALQRSTIAIGGMEECAVATGPTDDPATSARRLHDLDVEVAVVKLGAEGVLVSDASGVHHVPVTPVEVVCGLGAGDAFGAAFCAWLLAGASPLEAAHAGSVAGAIVASRLACAEAMPTRDEIENRLEDARAAAR